MDRDTTICGSDNTTIGMYMSDFLSHASKDVKDVVYYERNRVLAVIHSHSLRAVLRDAAKNIRALFPSLSERYIYDFLRDG